MVSLFSRINKIQPESRKQELFGRLIRFIDLSHISLCQQTLKQPLDVPPRLARSPPQTLDPRHQARMDTRIPQ